MHRLVTPAGGGVHPPCEFYYQSISIDALVRLGGCYCLVVANNSKALHLCLYCIILCKGINSGVIVVSTKYYCGCVSSEAESQKLSLRDCLGFNPRKVPGFSSSRVVHDSCHCGVLQRILGKVITCGPGCLNWEQRGWSHSRLPHSWGFNRIVD